MLSVVVKRAPLGLHKRCSNPRDRSERSCSNKSTETRARFEASGAAPGIVCVLLTAHTCSTTDKRASKSAIYAPRSQEHWRGGVRGECKDDNTAVT